MSARVAFACVWDHDREATWSHIPSNLLTALNRHVDVLDIEAEPGRLIQRLHHKQNRIAGQPEWLPRRWNDAWRELSVRAAVARRRPEVLLQINELCVVPLPYWVYRDMTWAQVQAYGGGDAATGVVDRRLTDRARRHERRVHRRASGVFTFSEWAARSVRETDGSRAVVVPPGVNAPVQVMPRPSPRTNILFVGRAFERKGGPELVRAFDLLSRTRPHLRLDVVGPDRLPEDIPHPAGLRFHGPLPPAEVSRLFSQAHLFVMPSRFEAYGIAVVEALAGGLPCVTRDVCAMREILQDGRLGVLAENGAPEALVRAIERALDDDGLYGRVAEAAPRLRQHFTWDRAARQMLTEMTGAGLA